MKKILVCAIACLAVFVLPVMAQNAIISQVDNTTLLSNQTISLWVSITGASGAPRADLTRDQFSIFESVPQKEGVQREIIQFKQGANVNEGISILFLLDNSESMYENIAGGQTSNERARRIYFAKEAIQELLRKIKNPEDRLSLVAFNIQVVNEVTPTSDKAQITRSLGEIQRPEQGRGYTELYESLYYSSTRLAESKGRKVIILLTDGENMAFTQGPHPQFKERMGLAKTLDYASRAGISVFSIGIIEGAANQDLKKISGSTGGVAYQVNDLSQLAQLYDSIRERVLAEYFITYYATMTPSDRKSVQVKINENNRTYDAKREYYSATLFGLPQDPFPFWIFVLIPIAIFLLWVLSRMKFQSKQGLPSLDVLEVDGKTKKMHPVTILEGQKAMTISASDHADLTIAGDPSIGHTEVTVVKKGTEYTVMSSGKPITVNNQKIIEKKLRSGDVITVGNSTIVFDEGAGKTLLEERTSTKTKKKRK
ncbi:MAG: VWA domain-containing protein [Spirochaetaceae bacterium]|nr:MAG: VWA domain-containing protein [Spirochaetaceae bacterium]